MDIARLLDDYTVWHEVSGHSPKTISLYRWVIGTFRTWLVTTGRSTAAQDITLADARAFLQAQQHRDELYTDHPQQRSRPGKLSDRTIHVHARSLRAFFRWLESEEYLAKTPLGKLKPPKLEKRYKEVLSVEEIERLLAELNPRVFLGARMYAIIALLYDSGLRASELCNLNVGDVDWGAYQVRVLGKGKN